MYPGDFENKHLPFYPCHLMVRFIVAAFVCTWPKSTEKARVNKRQAFSFKLLIARLEYSPPQRLVVTIK